MKLLPILALIFLGSCATDKNFVKFQANPKHEEQAAQHCATWYPIKQFTNTVTKTVQGKTDTIAVPGETVYIDCAEAVKNALDDASKRHIAVKCPPSKVITKNVTVYVHDTTVEENTAQIRAYALQNGVLQADLAAKTAEVDKYKADKRWWEKYALWTWGILLLIVIVRVFWRYITSKIP
jgi:hypothetical protein